MLNNVKVNRVAGFSEDFEKDRILPDDCGYVFGKRSLF
jgi:hypothetical protein